MAAAPLYRPLDVVYLRESAARGMLEAVTVRLAARSTTTDLWEYALDFAARPSTNASFGDYIQYNIPHRMYFAESEFVSACDAYELAATYHRSRLAAIAALQAAQC